MYSREDAKEILIKELINYGLDDINKRKSILNEFRKIAPDIIGHIPQPSTEIPYVVVRNIINTCDEYDEGIEQFIYAIYQAEGAHPTWRWKEIDEFVRTSILKSAASYTELKKVCNEVEAIENLDDILLDAYKKSALEVRRFPNFFEEPNVLMKMLNETAKMGCLPERVPVLEFVERLALHAHAQGQQTIANKLRTWIRYTGTALKLSDGQLQSIYNRAHRNTSYEKEIFLLFEISENYANPDINPCKPDNKYNIKAFLVYDENKLIDEFTIKNNEEQTISELKISILHLLDECFKNKFLQNIMGIATLTIEFIVPDELLDQDFDRWRVETDDGGFVLGLKYRVVVRSAERLRDVRWLLYKPAWDSKWDKFRELEMREASEAIACICATGKCELPNFHSNGDFSCAVLFCRGKDFHDIERLESALSGTSILCLALGDMPHYTNNATGSQRAHSFLLFQTLRWAGMPVALWAREGFSTELLIATPSPYFPLRSLPETVRQWRRSAAINGGEQAAGKDITLLWDDPTRLPPGLSAEGYKAPLTQN